MRNVIENIRFVVEVGKDKVEALWRSGKYGKALCVVGGGCLLWIGSCMFDRNTDKQIDSERVSRELSMSQDRRSDEASDGRSLMSRYDRTNPLHVFALANMAAPAKGLVCECIRGSFKVCNRVDQYLIVQSASSSLSDLELQLALITPDEVVTGEFLERGYYEFLGLEEFKTVSGNNISLRVFRKLDDSQSQRLQRELYKAAQEREKREAEERRIRDEKLAAERKAKHAAEQVRCENYAAATLLKIDFKSIFRNVVIQKSLADKVSLVYNRNYYDEMMQLQVRRDWLGMIRKACGAAEKTIIRNRETGTFVLSDQITAKSSLGREWEVAQIESEYPGWTVTHEVVSLIVHENVEFMLKVDPRISIFIEYLNPHRNFSTCCLPVSRNRSSFPLLTGKIYVMDMHKQPPLQEVCSKFEKEYKAQEDEIEVTMKGRTEKEKKLLELRRDLQVAFVTEYERVIWDN